MNRVYILIMKGKDMLLREVPQHLLDRLTADNRVGLLLELSYRLHDLLKERCARGEFVYAGTAAMVCIDNYLRVDLKIDDSYITMDKCEEWEDLPTKDLIKLVGVIRDSYTPGSSEYIKLCKVSRLEIYI